MKPPRWLLLVLPLLSLSFFPPIRSLMAQVAPHFGDPLPGLSDADLAAFAFGKEKFMAVQTPATGLGPVFNGRSCVACHSSPAPGGSGASLDNRVTRFARQVQGQPFDPLLHLGGPNLQKFSVGGELPGCSLTPEVVPAEANLTGLRQPPQLFGLGLIQGIPDTEILAPAGPTHAHSEGGAGAGSRRNGGGGRFGWKGAVPSILGFSGLALVNERGLP